MARTKMLSEFIAQLQHALDTKGDMEVVIRVPDEEHEVTAPDLEVVTTYKLPTEPTLYLEQPLWGKPADDVYLIY